MITRSRQVGVRWGKVEIITRKKTNYSKHNQQNSTKLKCKPGGKILGKTIDIALKGKCAVHERIRKARNKWHILRRKLVNRRKIQPRIKKLLRNALIRSTLTYGLQTHDIAIHDQQLIDSFAFTRMRILKTNIGTRKLINPTNKKFT